MQRTSGARPARPAARAGARERVEVAVVGAGFGGLGTALQLRRAGVTDVVVLDAAERVGGTWAANTYPGVACDAPSRLYSYSFARGSWSRRFAAGAEIAAYLERCAAGLDVRLGSRVETATWDGAGWCLTLAGGAELRARSLVLGTGQLRVPSDGDVPGLEEFAAAGGPVVHTARWRDDVPLDGLRVGVVGTGASAVQVVPRLAEVAAELTVFQRSAPYVYPKLDGVYSERAAPWHRRLPVVPLASRAAVWASFEAFGTFFWRWPGLMRLMETYHRRWLEHSVRDPELRAALTPTDRAGCKRPLVSSDYYPTLEREHVRLVTSAVTEAGPGHLRTADGSTHDLDAVVLATGFATGEFVAGVEVVGRRGRTLRETWARGASAYRGVSVPGFPNLFLVYGPNTNLGAGSIVHQLESQARHVVDAVRILAERPGQALEVTAEAHAREQAALQPRLARTVWATGCTSWYLDAGGRDTHNWPGTSWSYRRRVARVDLADHHLVPAQAVAPGIARTVTEEPA